MTYTARVDDDVCISSGRCVADLPGLFQFDEDEIAQVRQDPTIPSDAEFVAIARACPSGAIQLFSGGELVDIP